MNTESSIISGRFEYRDAVSDAVECYVFRSCPAKIAERIEVLFYADTSGALETL